MENKNDELQSNSKRDRVDVDLTNIFNQFLFKFIFNLDPFEQKSGLHHCSQPQHACPVCGKQGHLALWYYRRFD